MKKTLITLLASGLLSVAVQAQTLQEGINNLYAGRIKNAITVFEKLLVDAGKQLKEVQDPNNKMIASYAKNYPDMIKMIDLQHQSKIEQWEKEFPDNHLLFVKERLEMFMKETKNIDFDAALQVKNGKKYFVNNEYERKSSYWKMAFRAGRDVVLTAREYVADWISTIN